MQREAGSTDQLLFLPSVWNEAASVLLAACSEESSGYEMARVTHQLRT